MKNHPDHLLYRTGDADAPDVIKDRNGEVVLDLCRTCGRGEIELSEPCTDMGTSAQLGLKPADRLTDNDPLSPVDQGRKSGQK